MQEINFLQQCHTVRDGRAQLGIAAVIGPRPEREGQMVILCHASHRSPAIGGEIPMPMKNPPQPAHLIKIIEAQGLNVNRGRSRPGRDQGGAVGRAERSREADA